MLLIVQALGKPQDVAADTSVFHWTCFLQGGFVAMEMTRVVRGPAFRMDLRFSFSLPFNLI